MKLLAFWVEECIDEISKGDELGSCKSLYFFKCYIDNIIVIIVFGHNYHFNKCEHHFINITLMTSLYLMIAITLSANTTLYPGEISLTSVNSPCVGTSFKCKITSSEIQTPHSLLII
jgi:hypothetical protein